MIQQFHLWVSGQKIWKQDLEEILLPCVHRAIIYNSWNKEATQVSTGRWMDKQNIICAAVCSGTGVITATQEAVVGGSQVQKFKATMDNLLRSCL